MKIADLRLATLLLLPLLLAFRWPWQPASETGWIELSGAVEAREVDLAFQVGGRIAQLAVDEGDAVQTGQPIATLDPQDYDLALRNATAQMEAAQAALAASGPSPGATISTCLLPVPGPIARSLSAHSNTWNRSSA